MAKKICLYCGLHLPDTTHFCPQCGRPIEDAIRIESGVKIRRTMIAKGCLYCGLHLPDAANFCPQCGRPIERGFEIRPIRESQLDRLRKEIKGKGNLIRQKGFYYVSIGTLAHSGKSPKRGVRLARREGSTNGTLSTRECSSLQSKQPMRSKVRRVRAAPANRFWMMGFDF
jgi:RNA polymerase subunit RPABC4/transcription elongation factor Spt4